MAIERVYEARATSLRHGSLPAFLEQVACGEYAGLRRQGGEVLCVLGTVIGAPETDVLRLTAFTDLASWEASLSTYDRSPLVETESVRLLRPVAGRPLGPVPDEHRRAFYGYRRFHVDPQDLSEVVDMSENGVWPRIERSDARVLGLFAEIGRPHPLELSLLTGYHSPSHWEATRVWAGRPGHITEEEWEQSRDRRERRAELTRSQWVHLMRNIPFGTGAE